MTATLNPTTFAALAIIATAPVLNLDRCSLCGLLPDFCPCDSRDLFTVAPRGHKRGFTAYSPDAPTILTEICERETEWTVEGSASWVYFDDRCKVYRLCDGQQAMNMRRAELLTFAALIAHALEVTADR